MATEPKSLGAGSTEPALSLGDTPITLAAPGVRGAALSLAEPSDFFALMKPRVMTLVVFTAWAGLVCAPGQMNLLQAAASILCIAIGAGASAALNMWYEADTDALMSRTKTRPLPAGKMEPSAALAFGIILSALSVLGLAIAANYVAAALLLFTILFYAVVYTMWLKRSTPQNIVIGGAAGALPPTIGWAAASGDITVDSLLLFLIIFIWTPPHFWALALYKTGDYHKAGIPMMPNVKGAKSTRGQIFAYSIALAAICAGPVLTGFAGPLYMLVALVLNLGFLALAFRVWRSRAGEQADSADEASLYAVKSGDKAARNLFAFSIIYLFVIFAALAAEGLLKGFS
ncbi:MAG: heme o synthase [Robiginitomaculum sp.]